MNRDELLKEFFEQQSKRGFVTRLRTFLHRDFAHETVKDFRAFLFKRFKQMGKAPEFDLMALVPEIIQEIGAIQVESVKLYTKFLHDEAVSNLKGRENGQDGQEKAEVYKEPGQGAQGHQEDGEKRDEVRQENAHA